MDLDLNAFGEKANHLPVPLTGRYIYFTPALNLSSFLLATLTNNKLKKSRIWEFL